MLAKKCFFVGILTFLSLSLAIADPPAEHPITGEPLLIDCLRGTPDAIDGDLSDWDLGAMTPAVLDTEEQIFSGAAQGAASWDSPGDSSGKFYLLWDDENIYIAVVMKDGKLSMNKYGSDIWNADCIEIFFSTTDAVPTTSSPSEIHYQYGFNANDQRWNWCNMDGNTNAEPDYLQIASSETADGYICEASIEYGQMLSLDFTAGNTIGFHPVFDDADNGDRKLQMTWTSREAHDQSLGFGHIFLSDAAVAPGFSSGPRPANGAMIEDTWVNLTWMPGAFAVSHDVYFGESFDDVDAGTGGTFQGNQIETVFAVGVDGSPYPDGLLMDTTYYWRVDEVNAPPDSTIYKGDVWSFTVSSSVEDFEGNDFSTFPWEHHGDASWTITSYEKHSGTYSAQAGAIDHDERTTLQVLLDCVSGDITFYRKVSSEGGCDYLKFYIDGEEKSKWSGTTDWEQVSFPVRAGTRIFDWTYSKDGSISSHWDTAWVDDIVFPIGADTIPTGEVIELADATFNQTVLSSDVPVLVDFWAPWCGPCLVMAPVIEEIADEYAGRVKVCKLNVDNAPGTTTNYGIRFIPTFILFKDGQVQRQWVGVTNKYELTAAIDELL